MKYYITADVHGFFTQLKEELTRKGFFEDPEPHKLVICGDLYDRGTEALQLQAFLLELLSKDQLILIRGNHEDLALDLLYKWNRKSYLQRHHNLNGTVDTVCQLTGFSEREVYTKTDEVGRAFLHDPFVRQILPATVDYFETGHYIFVHGWIPCLPISHSSTEKEYVPVPDWRNADKELWEKAQEYLRKQAEQTSGENKPEYRLSNIISKVCSIHPSYNLLNVYDLTIFQLYDAFFQLSYMRSSDLSERIFSNHGGDKFHFEDWLKPIQNNI